jgi:polysaccharide export outer membrane protein
MLFASQPGEAPKPAAIAPVKSAEPGYRLGPGDVLKIDVYGLPELGRTARISNSGKIHFQSLGIFSVVGLTSNELELDIAKRLRDAGQVKNPSVSVEITDHRALPVYILGEIELPGQFIMTDKMTVLDLLVLAAGFNEVASKVGYLYRRKLKDPVDGMFQTAPEATQEEEAILLDFPAITSGTHPELNLELRGGDILYVPVGPRNRYFVVGDVLKTGSFDLDPERNLLASEAIAKAGGPNKTAKLNQGIVVRYNDDQKREEVAVDFDAILRGKKADFEIRPGDVIFIPGSTVKTLGYGLLNVLPGMAGRMATGIP